MVTFAAFWFLVGAIVAHVLYKEARRTDDRAPLTLAALGFLMGPVLLVYAVARAMRAGWSKPL